MRFVLLALLLFSLTTPCRTILAASAPLPSPGPREKCPVCGMFVAKFPDWTAAVVRTDGSVLYCDGVKDLLRLLHEPPRYGLSLPQADIAGIRVKDYYSLEGIDGSSAFYVLGSDILGPMGKELIPFARRAEAMEFMRDHKGRQILSLTEVTPAILASLD
ncbi:MAG: hypothetical protein A2091_03730 [Desulfuromonadales bacterium GWD2_61_12]|nr:MAG: hypothetical protein A2005_09155 [Desulfuromonadales bacterium GWC2_61_20]OGR36114.1 MAG: hypothetical protein A2091_03730 [Desulfuromonadales bacterium GWD2_61_12]HAD04895.1 nitrous oxide reductase accessory protein NosL [Desulfuromonas sp.]HBT83654.1 nitrous oxide reductase accessory protein NosL [Desulfuromonas sp.]